MKALHLIPLVAASLLSSVNGDLTIVQKIEGPSPINSMTIKFKGDKARVDVSPEMSTIIDTKTGDVTTLLLSQKTVMRISGDQAQALAAMAKNSMPQPGTETPKLVATGRKETINGYETQEYTSDTPAYKGSYWIATQFPDYAEVLKQMQAMQGGRLAVATKGMPDFRDFPGMPIRTKIKIEGQGDFTHTIVSVKRDALPDSDFVAPKDFSEMTMPSFPGQRPKGGNKKAPSGE